MRSERPYLLDVLEAADAIASFVRGFTVDAFVRDDLVRSAVLHKLTVIGEAIANVPPEFRNRHPSVEWREIVAFRNFAVHVYFAVDWQIVWTTATIDVPELRAKIARIRDTEFPDAP